MKKHNTKVMCMFCFQDFTVRKKQRAQPQNHSRNSNTSSSSQDLWMCPSCEAQQIVHQYEDSFCDYCLYCDFRYNVQGTCACQWNQLGSFGIRVSIQILKNGYDMLYCHYEKFALPVDVGNMPAGSEMMKFKFSSSSTNRSVVNFKRDGETLKKIIELIKQIPSSKRSYDPSTYIWTIPFANKILIEGMLLAQSVSIGTNPSNGTIEHPDLDAFINPPKQDPDKKNSWHINMKVEVENPEDFFYKPPTTLSEPDIKVRLIEIIKPFLSLPPSMDEVNREWFLRGYKITARRLHPDLGGDPKKMSELNELWSQYKELGQ